MGEHESSTVAGAYTAAASPVAPGYVEVTYQNLSHYTKFIPALAAAAGTVFVQLNGKGNTLFIVLSILIAVLQAFGTYQFGAGDKVLNSGKFWTNILAVVAQAVLAIVGSGGNLGDITSTQWVTIGLTVLGTLGVGILPNGPKLSQQVIADVDGVYSVASPSVQTPKDLG